MERLAAQLKELKLQLSLCQDSNTRQRLQNQFRELEGQIRTQMELTRATIQQAQQENTSMRIALENLKRREQ